MTKSWLPAVTLPRTGATAMAADAQGTAVAYGTSVYRYGIDFTGEVLLGSTSSNIESLFFDGNLLIAVHSTGSYSRVTILNRTSGAELSSVESYVDTLYGASHAPLTNRLYGRTQGTSPSDIVTASYTDAGVASSTIDSPYHGDYPSAARTWIFPNESRVVDSSGTVYTAPGLNYFGSFAGTITDIAFNGDVPVVLRGGELIAFTPNLLETGRAAAGASNGAELQVTASEAFVFSPGSTRPSVSVVALSAINAQEPGTPVNPDGLAYTVDDAFPDKDGNLLLFSKGQQSLFRWSPSTRQYTGSIPLAGVPKYAAYSRENHSAYFAYETQEIRKMDLSAGKPKEVPFVNLPTTADGLATAGAFVFASDSSGAWGTHYVYSPAGALLHSLDWNYYSRVWEWDATKRRMYFFRDDTSPNDLHYETIDTTGKITGEGETPYHGDFTVTPPIRISPDSSKVVIGSGVVFNTEGLTKASSLANGFSDAVWSGSKLVTLRLINGVSQLQVWEGDQLLPGATVRQFNGNPVRLFNTSAGLCVITSIEGTPRFTLLNAALDTIYISPSRPLAPAAPTLVTRTENSISLAWQDMSDNEDSFRVEYRIGTGAWVAGTTTGSGVTQAVVSGLVAGTVHEFRVVAVNGTLVSAPSSSVSGKTLSTANEPVGEPYNLIASRIFNNWITLEWRDNANNETAFRIYRSTSSASLGTQLQAPANAVSYTDTGLTAGTTYYYRVQAVNGAITGDLSAQVSATTLSSNSAPTAPSQLTVADKTANSVSLTWKDSSTNEDSFTVERSVTSTTWTTVATLGFNQTAYTDTTAVPNTTYSYRIRAANSVGSTVSYTVSATTPKLGGDFAGHSIRAGDVHYFAFSAPNRIERYDLAARQWLAPVALQAAATALWADEAGIYVAEDRAVVRFNLDGSARTPLGNGESTVNAIFTLGSTLVFQNGSTHTSLDKITGIFLSTYSIPYFVYGNNFVVSGRRAYFRSSYGVGFLEIGTDGKLLKSAQTPYSSGSTSNTRFFLFPNGSRVAGDGGTVFDTEALASNNSLGSAFTDLSFYGADVPVVLRSNKLTSYTNTLLEAGSFTLSANGLRLAVAGTDAVVFIADGTSSNGLRVQTVPLSQLAAPVPGQPIDPRGLAFTPDDVFVDKDGNVLLFSKAQLSLFRWSPAEKRYLSTIPLLGAPSFAAYSAENHAAYFAYASQVVRKLDLATSDPVETPLFNLPSAPGGLTTAGQFLYVVANGIKTFTPAGEPISSGSGSTYYTSNHNVCDPANRRVYHFRDGISPNDLLFDVISTSGAITASGETPYHGDFTATKPIRVSPDGTQVVIGSGVVFSANGLAKTASLANDFTDGAWHGGRLVTVRLINGVTQLQTWHGSQFTLGSDVRQVSGTPMRLLPLDSDQLLLITVVEGIPRFTILNTALEPVYVSPAKPLPPSSLAVSGRTASTVSLAWNDGSDNEGGFAVEYRTGTGEWLPGGDLPPNTTAATVSGLTAGTTYEFRVSAYLGDLKSNPSPTVAALTLTGPDQPVGEPYLLRITRVFHDRITLEWQDNATNETAFRVLRSTTAGGAVTTFTAAANTTTYTLTGLSPATTYYFRVQVTNGGIAGDLSTQLSATTLSSNSAPTAPSLLTVADKTANSVSLTWKDNSSNEDSFAVERSVNSTTWTTVATLGFNQTAYTDNTAAPNTAYTYRIRAANSVGSTVSYTVSATTPKLGGEFTGHSIRAGDIQYFAFSGPNRIERYDLAARQWLASVALQAAATALWADEAGIYVAEDRAVVRFNLDGSGRTPIGNGESTVNAIVTLDSTLVFQNGSTHTSLDKITGIFLSTYSIPYFVYGNNFVVSGRRAYFRSSYGVGFLEIGTDGKLAKSAQSPYSSGSTSNTRFFLFPNGSRVAGDGGTVFDTEALAYNNSLGSTFTDLGFYGTDIPIVLRGNKLTSYTNTLLEAGSFTLSANGLRVAVNGEDAVVFSLNGQNEHGLGIQVVPLADLSTPKPGDAIDPRGLAFTPDDVFVDKNGNVLLFSKAQLSLFRWSPAEKRYLSTIPLLGAPSFAAYSAENHAAYFAYASQVVRKLDLATSDPVETPLFNLPSAPGGLTTAGEFLYVVANGIKTFSPAGEPISSGSGSTYYTGNHNTWDPVSRRVYHFRDGISPNDLHYDAISAAGAVTASGETPYHGDFTVTKPIRVSPDGTQVVIGSGVVFSANGLTKHASLANDFADGAWHGGRLVTARAINSITQLQTWHGSQFTLGSDVRQVSGAPVRVLPLDAAQLLLITVVDGIPRFTILNTALEPVYVSPAKPLPPSSLAVAGRTTSTVNLTWNDGSDNEGGFAVEYRTGTGAWLPGGDLPPNTTAATVSGLTAGTTYEFRVTAYLGDLKSTPSATVAALTLTGPDQPAGEPYLLRITRVFHDRITLEWQDNATNETVFRVMRSTTADGTVTTFTAPANTTTYTLTGLSPATTYYFRVQVTNGGIAGDLSTQLSATTLSSNSAPTAPSQLTVADKTATSVALTWKDNSTNEDSFTVERSVNSTTWTTVATLGFNQTAYTDTTAAPNTAYTYRIRAANSVGSTVSYTVSATTLKLGGDFAGHSIRAGDVHYFAFSGPNRIERYDLATRQWLAPVALQATATALWADEAGIYVAEDRAVVRFNLDGNGRTPIGNGEATVRTLFTLKEVLVFNTNSQNLTTMNKRSGIFLSNISYSYSGAGYSVAPGLNRVFFRSTSVSPSDIHYLEIGPDGKLVVGNQSPYHGDYASATRTFLFPNGARVADDSGTVYSTDSLTYTNSLGAAFTDLDFHGPDIPIVLRSNKLTSYTNTLLEAGSFTLSSNGLRLAVSGTDALVFIADGTTSNGLRVQTVPLSQLAAPVPGQPIEPRGLAFTPDEVFVDKNGELLLFSKAQLSLFRWSPRLREYLPSLPLLGSPKFAAYSKERHRAYFAYETQLVREMDLSADLPVESPLFSMSAVPRGLATAGEFIFADDESGAWDSHYVFSPEGQQLQAVEWNRYSRVWEWDPAKRRMYFFRDDTSPNDLHYETISSAGIITGEGETPYHGDFNVTPPIRVNTDGNKVVIGSGVVFETAGMTKLATLPNTFTDAMWRTNELLTIRSSGSGTQIQRWNSSTFAAGASVPTFTGTPMRLLALNASESALITLVGGVPRIYLLNEDLSVAFTYESVSPIVPPIAVEDMPYSWKPTVPWQKLGTGPLTITAPVLPAWLKFENGILSGTPLDPDSGDPVSKSKTHRLVLRAVNQQNISEEKELSISVIWRNDAPTVSPNPMSVTANPKADDTHLDLKTVLSDPDDKDSHFWQIASVSNPSIFSNLLLGANGILDISYTPYISGSSVVLIDVTDLSGASARIELDVTLPELPPPGITVDPKLFFNRATGLYEQKVTVKNLAARAIAGFDLTVSGLRSGVSLYNATSKKKGGDTISYRKPIAADQSITLVLNYYASKRGTIPTPKIGVSLFIPTIAAKRFVASAAPKPSGTANTAAAMVDGSLTNLAGTVSIQSKSQTTAAPAVPFAISSIARSADGSMIVEFPTESGRNYRMQYSGDCVRWIDCPELISGNGARMLWIDRGPPSTETPPASASRRFYRLQRFDP